MTETLPEPASREDEYLATIAGMTGITVPQPASRKEEYLYAIATNGGGGGGGGTSDFNQLSNRPKYNGAAMTGETDIPAAPTVVQTTGNSTTSVMSQDAVTSALSSKEDKGTTISLVINPASWSDELGIDPYTKSVEIAWMMPLTNDSVVELINDDPVNFAKYGFAIQSVNTSTNIIKVISIGAPDTFVSLTINVK